MSIKYGQHMVLTQLPGFLWLSVSIWLVLAKDLWAELLRVTFEHKYLADGLRCKIFSQSLFLFSVLSDDSRMWLLHHPGQSKEMEQTVSLGWPNMDKKFNNKPFLLQVTSFWNYYHQMTLSIS